ncbi:hypothetical protein BDK51DRAFT_52705 [Blyttiomyces helicus]|uniref:Uncharacterized protein n=1 Tax=Blyttiomyces helicus TaxID=388810 RepID=A0A4P9WSB5_9FUNG|nr:hypothetical protein BDK51DRAFT_52705 [Blyttiomyces helicus]|eukprot:RKO93886.1 hypothetical protein BDK51DRAFT_52705 [Blyttiomyces helicus]
MHESLRLSTPMALFVDVDTEVEPPMAVSVYLLILAESLDEPCLILEAESGCSSAFMVACGVDPDGVGDVRAAVHLQVEAAWVGHDVDGIQDDLINVPADDPDCGGVLLINELVILLMTMDDLWGLSNDSVDQVGGAEDPDDDHDPSVDAAQAYVGGDVPAVGVEDCPVVDRAGDVEDHIVVGVDDDPGGIGRALRRGPDHLGLGRGVLYDRRVDVTDVRVDLEFNRDAIPSGPSDRCCTWLLIVSDMMALSSIVASFPTFEVSDEPPMAVSALPIVVEPVERLVGREGGDSTRAALVNLLMMRLTMDDVAY